MIRVLDILCWEDLRTKVDKADQPQARQQRKGKNVDAQSLKINN
jgi:hypothetical protein